MPETDESDLRQLAVRLRQANWPPRESLVSDGWRSGMPWEYLARLVEVWIEFLESGAYLQELRSREHWVYIEGATSIHFQHRRSSRTDAVPLVLTHGWPSSDAEFRLLVDELVSPSDPDAPAFHVVVPSLPGFGPSARLPRTEDHTAANIADIWASLMATLGYTNFVASGGDIGARVTGWLASRHPSRVLGIHVSSNLVAPQLVPSHLAKLDPVRRWTSGVEEWWRTEGAYEHLHQTKPSTLAFSLHDSPIGLASWIGEKWHGWAPGLDRESPAFLQQVARVLTCYWTSGSVASTLLPYYAMNQAPGPRPSPATIGCPVAMFVSERELGGVPPRTLVSSLYPLVQWTELTSAGHFPALEEPDTYITDLRALARLTTSGL